MSRVYTCHSCDTEQRNRRTCRNCNRPTCLDCIAGRPMLCLSCTRQQMIGETCRRKRCPLKASEFTWKRLAGRDAQPKPLCTAHAEQAAESFSLKLIPTVQEREIHAEI